MNRTAMNGLILVNSFIIIPLLFSVSIFAGMDVGMNFWNVKWGGGGAVPFKNTYKNVSGDNPWKQSIIEEASNFTHLRFMDWQGINNELADYGPGWNSRKQKSNPDQSAPMAWEWCIDLCNRTNTDMWVNIHSKYNEDYSYNLAQLIKNNLKPELRVYVEWGNEVWNPAYSNTAKFWSYHNALAGAEAKGFNNLSYGYSHPEQVYQVWAAIRHHQQFERVFGKGSDRLISVLAGWDAPQKYPTQITAYRDPAINPEGFRFDAYAIGYPDHEEAAGWKQRIDALNNVMGSKTALITYEAHVNERGTGAIKNYFDDMNNYFHSFCYYTMTGKDSQFYWGLKAAHGDPATTQWTEAVNWVTTNPPHREHPRGGTQNVLTPVRGLQHNNGVTFVNTSPSGAYSISYNIANAGPVSFSLFQLNGIKSTELFSGFAHEGFHAQRVTTDAPAGTYILRQDVNGQASSQLVKLK